ncbi:hypothetical protein FRC07_003918 [Ceratobasidium sp. 392]|nr:hypothetical protein FRC07_003918 [Ceratobasidium sp. 392]
MHPRYQNMADIEITFDEEFLSEDWYKGSLSQLLNNLVCQVKPVALASTYKILYDAMVNVFRHEYLIHKKLKLIPKGTPVNPDPAYVLNGYVKALELLEMKLYCTSKEDQIDRSIAFLQDTLVRLFKQFTRDD